MYQNKYSKNLSIDLSLQDMTRLVCFFQSAFEHFSLVESSLEENYRESIFIISNCYGLIINEMGEIPIEEESLAFLSQKNFFKQYREHFKSLAVTLVEMIDFVTKKIKLINYPWFYHHFVAAVATILNDQINPHYEDLEIRRLKKLISHHSF
jgi:hypothetical protein